MLEDRETFSMYFSCKKCGGNLWYWDHNILCCSICGYIPSPKVIRAGESNSFIENFQKKELKHIEFIPIGEIRVNEKMKLKEYKISAQQVESFCKFYGIKFKKKPEKKSSKKSSEKEKGVSEIA